MMNIVDSSGWLEYFSAGPNTVNFMTPLQNASSLIVPVNIIYEVFKVVLRESGEGEALQAVVAMQKGKTVDLTTGIAMNASKLSLQYTLPMAESIILAVARAYKCTIWTQDSYFKNLSGVKFFSRTPVER